MPDRLEILPVHGLPEIRPGADLAALIARTAPWLRTGDVVVVTSKVVSKAEGRLLAAPPDPVGRERARQQAVAAETVREVARRGGTSIVETRHGLVLAAAGVDASNVRTDEIALLPADPDASARALRAGLQAALRVRVGVVVSDTMGRPWRHGLVDAAIGVAGRPALRDERGRQDAYGNELAVTEVAEADEIAAAADLVKGKLAGVPVAVVRGLPATPDDDGYGDRRGAQALIRPAEMDMFRLGTAEAKRAAVADRRDAAELAAEPVDAALVRRAVAAALTAPGAGACRFALATAAAPYRLVPCLAGPADPLGWLALGAAVEALLIALAADGLAGRWDRAAEPAVRLPAGWSPGGVLTIGRALRLADPPTVDLDTALVVVP